MIKVSGVNEGRGRESQFESGLLAENTVIKPQEKVLERKIDRRVALRALRGYWNFHR
jgi:hypothetical protein